MIDYGTHKVYDDFDEMLSEAYSENASSFCYNLTPKEIENLRVDFKRAMSEARCLIVADLTLTKNSEKEKL